MKTPLASIRDCFEGVIPSIIATLDADGLPNVSYLSQVYLVDDEHVALSNQFFSKTAANVAATGRAHVLLVSGRTGEQFALDVEQRHLPAFGKEASGRGQSDAPRGARHQRHLVLPLGVLPLGHVVPCVVVLRSADGFIIFQAS